MTDSYIAYANNPDPVSGLMPTLQMVKRDPDTPVTDFGEALEMAQEAVRDGRADSGLEVVELTVQRRAVVRRAVEVVVEE